MPISTYVNKALLSLCVSVDLCVLFGQKRALRGRQPLVLSRLQPPEGLNIRGGNSELPRVWQLTDCIMYSSHVIGQSKGFSFYKAATQVYGIRFRGLSRFRA